MDPEELERLSAKEVVAKIVELLNDSDASPEAVDDVVDCFLFAYSPEHNFAIIEDNNDTLQDLDLLSVCMNKCKNSYTPEIFLEFVNLLSSVEGFEIEMAKQSCVQAIVSVMLKDDHNARTQELGCKALGNLAKNVYVRDWVGKCKGIQRILSAIERHKDKVDSLPHFIGALVNITNKSIPNKTLLINQKGVDILMNLLETHKKSPSIASRCLCVLRNITASKMVTELHQHTLLRLTLSVMESQKSNATIQTHALWTIINLLARDVDVKQYISENCSVTLERICNTMEIHQSNPVVQLPATTATALLSRINTCRSVIVKYHGIPKLLSVMNLHRENIPIQRAILKTFYRMAANYNVREDLVKGGVVIEIIKTLKKHPHNGPLQRVGCICLTQFTRPTNTTQARDEILKNDGITVFTQATLKFQGNALVENVARNAMDALLKPSSFSKDKTQQQKKQTTDVSGETKNRTTDNSEIEDNVQDSFEDEEDIEKIRAELSAARKQLAEKAKILAKTQKKLDQTEGEKVKYKNQLRTTERKLKKLSEPKSLTGSTSKPSEDQVNASLAKATVLAQIKAKKEQIESDKQMYTTVQANKSAVLAEIKLMKKDKDETKPVPSSQQQPVLVPTAVHESTPLSTPPAVSTSTAPSPPPLPPVKTINSITSSPQKKSPRRDGSSDDQHQNQPENQETDTTTAKTEEKGEETSGKKKIDLFT